MLAQENAPAEQQVEPAVVPPAPAVEPAPQTFQTEGALPATEQAAAAPTVTASEMAFENKPVNSTAIEHGVFQPDEYRHACETAGKPDKWKESYRFGHTKAKAWSTKGNNQFSLKKGHSASAAIGEFFKGPTVASWHAIAVAEQLDELRDELGDHTFDRLFGSSNNAEDKNVPGGQRLRIDPEIYTTPFIDQMKAIAAADEEKANKPEAQQPRAQTPPEEEKQPRPGKNAQAKHDTEADQDVDMMQQREMGLGSEDLQRA